MRKIARSTLAGVLSLAFAFGAVPALVPGAVPTAHAELAQGNPSPKLVIDFKQQGSIQG